MNKEISYFIAKLLKDKGFDVPQLYFYINGEISWKVDGSRCRNKIDNEYSAPTIADVVMWLYEKHGIWVSVTICITGSDEWDYGYIITYLPKEFENVKRRATYLITKESFKESTSSYTGAWHSPTEAYEKAIEYTLTNLIN